MENNNVHRHEEVNMWNYILDIDADCETFCIFVNINHVRHILQQNL